MTLRDEFIYRLARSVIALIQAMPIRWVARLGRWGGGIAYAIDARHRKVALRNLARCFPTKTEAEIKALARENFRRIGENYACAFKTSSMDRQQLSEVVEVRGLDVIRNLREKNPVLNCVFALGHFGNFELFTRFPTFLAGFEFVTTYRAIRPPVLNDLIRNLRSASGVTLFERRHESGALKAVLKRGGVLLGLLADQSAKEGGVNLTFLGHPCSTSRAPAIFALRYACALFVPICFRTGPARWVIEVGEPISVESNGARRDPSDITREINHRFEGAVERDPANWFWVHNRWKTYSVNRPAVNVEVS
jgi:KDO2-lipid IV(A) lauroyltransferase